MQRPKAHTAGQAGAEIEVTPEMIEAGMELLSGGCVGPGSTYEVAEEVYRAMEAVRRSSQAQSDCDTAE